MLGRIFQWIYTMNISMLLLLIAGATAASAYAYRKIQTRWWSKPVIGLLLIAYIAVILFITLFVRSVHAEPLTPSLIPFDSYRKVLNGENRELLRSCFMNVVLFYPVGLLTVILLPQKWHPVIRIVLIGFIFTLMSAGIEYAQYAYALGQPEVDDVIHNVLGTMIGGGFGCLITSSGSGNS